jgi:hypothetical protein
MIGWQGASSPDAGIAAVLHFSMRAVAAIEARMAQTANGSRHIVTKGLSATFSHNLC